MRLAMLAADRYSHKKADSRQRGAGLDVVFLRGVGPMDAAGTARHEQLSREWTDQYVQVNPARPELKRFEGIVGRVITVNWNNRAVIDFQDGGWYDISASSEFLSKLDPAEAKAKFNAKANSAQPIPEKQG
jgi:hypothetical protein